MVSKLEARPFSSLSNLADSVITMAKPIPSSEPLWFRGTTCETYDLSPKLCRGKERPPAEVYEREARLLARFRERSQPYWNSAAPQSTWEHLFAMQHHGTPTRLLDWSENLFVAAYFAASGSKATASEHRESGHHEGACRPTVWAFRPVAWNREIAQLQDTGIAILTVADAEAKKWEPQTSTSERLARRASLPVAMYGVHNTARIVAQRGTFTVAGEKWLSLDGHYTSQDSWGQEDGDCPVLSKFVFDGEPSSLVGEISRVGFAESMIYPDLVGLSRELDRSEGWLTDD